MDHLDETGRPCTRHVPESDDALLGLSLLGSRVAGYQHDAASKLQMLVMALEEIGERAHVLADAPLVVALEGAREAVRDLTAQLQAFRALGKAPRPSKIPLGVLFARAAERAGVRLTGELPERELEVAVPEIVHATALLLDGAVGARPVREVRVAFTEHGFEVPVGASPEMIGIASRVFRRGGGELRCSPTALVVTW